MRLFSVSVAVNAAAAIMLTLVSRPASAQDVADIAALKSSCVSERQNMQRLYQALADAGYAWAGMQLEIMQDWELNVATQTNTASLAMTAQKSTDPESLSGSEPEIRAQIAFEQFDGCLANERLAQLGETKIARSATSLSPAPAAKSADIANKGVGGGGGGSGCLKQGEGLMSYGWQFIENGCSTMIRYALCFTDPKPDAAKGVLTCSTTWVGRNRGMHMLAPGGRSALGNPGSYGQWFAFACSDPEIPEFIRWNGSAMTGECVAPEAE